ncbi:MarR family transcriptional regulator [Peribacillus sp. FSL P2-0133]|uniref:MarR family transcriptional regulator n=1 Tax=Peribacillus sp. FSL P2-0133 TaxID=2921573 RepID=UPI0030CCC8B3
MMARALDSISKKEFKEYDLTKGQYFYLVRIWENRGIIQEKLAEMIKVDRTTAACAIKELEINGFIEKKGEKHNNHCIEVFSERAVETIFNLLQRVRKNIEKDWEFVKKEN